jgi:hypothetical protein
MRDYVFRTELSLQALNKSDYPVLERVQSTGLRAIELSFGGVFKSGRRKWPYKV